MAEVSTAVDITAQCLCKAYSFSAKVPSSKLPLEAEICHCNSCRHSTGALWLSETTWPQPLPEVNITGLRTYKFSEKLTYHFCGTCYTLLFYTNCNLPNKLGIFTGVLKNTPENIIKYTKHIFVGDTIDGGASVWLRRPNQDGQETKRYKEFDGEIPWTWPDLSSTMKYMDRSEQNSIPVYCHCKGVNLLYNRTDYASKTDEKLPFFVDPKAHKILGSSDPCDSCRLQCSSDMVAWAFPELRELSAANGGGGAFPDNVHDLRAAVDAGDPAVGTLVYYASSPSVQRYYCRVCSAGVFYANESRPSIVDLAVGLLGAAEGARAEGYVSWTFGVRPVWYSDVVGSWRESLVSKAVKEAEEWRVAREYPKNWARLMLEQRAAAAATAKKSGDEAA